MAQTTRARAAGGTKPKSTKEKPSSSNKTAAQKVKSTTKATKTAGPKQKIASKVRKAAPPKTKKTVVKSYGPGDKTDLWSPTPKQRKKVKMTDAEATALLDSFVSVRTPSTGVLSIPGAWRNSARSSMQKSPMAGNHPTASRRTSKPPDTGTQMLNQCDATTALQKTFGPENAKPVFSKTIRIPRAKDAVTRKTILEASAQRHCILKAAAMAVSNDLMGAQRGLALFLQVLAGIDAAI